MLDEKFFDEKSLSCSSILAMAARDAPGPREHVLQCFIRRNNASQTYYMFLSLSSALVADDGKFLLAARKFRRPTCTDYIIFVDADDMSRESNASVGKLSCSTELFLATKLVVSPENGHAGLQEDEVILQFGKIGKDLFTMDYQYPISSFQAFAICLNSFATTVTSSYENILHHMENISIGNFVFTTRESGNYLACFWVGHSERAGGDVSMNLDWKTGIAAKDWDSVAKKEKIEGKESGREKNCVEPHAMLNFDTTGEFIYCGAGEFIYCGAGEFLNCICGLISQTAAIVIEAHTAPIYDFEGGDSFASFGDDCERISMEQPKIVEVQSEKEGRVGRIKFQYERFSLLLLSQSSDIGWLPFFLLDRRWCRLAPSK
ncbi:hypothetical protein JHK86_004258 [Glycine max]|nr:hypothetical protein JHK86_004258 [Glycine max]